jgi:diguanylate cyclase (GGDEF)-like protein/PAS domain S-box-containing protein
MIDRPLRGIAGAPMTPADLAPLTSPDSGPGSPPGPGAPAGLWEAAVRSGEDAVFGLDGEGRVHGWTESARRLFGYSEREISGREGALLFAKAPGSDFNERVGRAMGGETIFRLPATALRKDGMLLPIALTLAPIPGQNGLCAVVRDLTEQVAAQEALEESHRRQSEALALSKVGFWLWDIKSDAIQMSDELYRIHGIDPLDFDGTMTARLTLAHPGDRRDLRARLRDSITTAEPFDLEYRIVRPDQTVVWVYERAQPDIGSDGSLAAVNGICQDITERHLAAEALAHQAMHDQLTGLPNRLLFLDRLGHSIRGLRSTDSHLAVMFIDLDNFKLINDSLGHDVGDEVLKAVADRLVPIMRQGDTAARFGGDEFVVLCERLVSDEAVADIANRLLLAIKEPMELSDEATTVVSASIGIAMASAPDARPDHLLRDADAAMYRAKEEGRGRFHVFDTALHERASRKLSIANELRTAVERGELRLEYQPQVRLSDGRLVGVESLVRWDSPGRGTLGPAAWIPIAEETQLIVTVGEWILAEACRVGTEWKRRHGTSLDPRFKVGVNVSAVQLARPELIDCVVAALRDTGMDPAALCIEITESVLMRAPEQSLEALLGLKMLGLSIAVDDFGTGYSSLAYLHRFPIDVIKIDKSFVDGLNMGDERGRAIVRAVVELSEALGVQSVAEGVETAEQAAELTDAGCQAAQGYFYCRPRRPEDLEAWLQAGSHPAGRPGGIEAGRDGGTSPCPR